MKHYEKILKTLLAGNKTISTTLFTGCSHEGTVTDGKYTSHWRLNQSTIPEKHESYIGPRLHLGKDSFLINSPETIFAAIKSHFDYFSRFSAEQEFALLEFYVYSESNLYLVPITDPIYKVLCNAKNLHEVRSDKKAKNKDLKAVSDWVDGQSSIETPMQKVKVTSIYSAGFC